ncbi:hypothetical protein ACQEVB_15940 [Pseudonocardia sp. CA-107938]|uniref:hypothetical protein n=1 Tax=Pseudonocardia sp. CA-107938 TaxID=3240021 RepID=UPI003D90E1C2
MRARTSITASYGLTGLLTAVWTATLPTIDAHLQLGPARLGTVLTALAAGALAAMVATGWLAGRGTAPSLRPALPATALALAATGAAPTLPVLVVAATLLGASTGLLNVLLNLRAGALERALARPVMAALHGTWGIGAVAGGLATVGALGAGVPAPVFVLGAATVVGAVGAALPDGPIAAPPITAVPPRAGLVVVLGLLGAAAFVAEGAAIDWAGVHAARVLGAAPALAAVASTVFFAAMTVLRLSGAAVRTRLGAARTLRLGGLTAAAGHGIVLLAGLPPDLPLRLGVAALGWVLAGAGLALVWPTVAGAVGAASRSAGHLAAVTTISYAGGLLGPAAMGIVAGRAGLAAALLLPTALALLLAAAAPAAVTALTTPERTPR